MRQLADRAGMKRCRKTSSRKTPPPPARILRRAMADRIAVMKDGKIVEEGATETLLANPRADYTRRLLAAAFTGKVERVKGIEPSS